MTVVAEMKHSVEEEQTAALLLTLSFGSRLLTAKSNFPSLK